MCEFAILSAIDGQREKLKPAASHPGAAGFFVFRLLLGNEDHRERPAKNWTGQSGFGAALSASIQSPVPNHLGPRPLQQRPRAFFVFTLDDPVFGQRDSAQQMGLTTDVSDKQSSSQRLERAKEWQLTRSSRRKPGAPLLCIENPIRQWPSAGICDDCTAFSAVAPAPELRYLGSAEICQAAELWYADGDPCFSGVLEKVDGGSGTVTLSLAPH